MVQSLFDLSSHAVRNAIVKGEITNVSHLPVTLRRWIFEMVHMKRVQNHKNVVQVFEQAGFFDGFTAISTHEKQYLDCISYYGRKEMRCGRFLSSLVSIFGSNPHLAENITELSLWVSNSCQRRTYQRPKQRVRIDLVKNLLQLCKNLKRLQLKAALGTEGCGQAAVLQRFSETANVAFHQLEELALIGSNPPEKIDQFPKQWFRSIRSLELWDISYHFPAYADVLACCQDTLVSLKVSDNGTALCDLIGSPVPICLPNLTSLTFESRQPVTSIFMDIQKRCPNLKTATLIIRIDTISDTELISLSQLANRLSLYLTLGTSLNVSEFVKIAGQSIFGLQIGRKYFSERDHDSILSFCTSVRRLDVPSIGNKEMNFLQNFLQDKEKAMKLEELYLGGSSSPQILKLLFANCCNLRCLDLTSSSPPVDLSSDLQLWVEGGARPISLVLSGFKPVCPNTVCSLLKASGHELKTMSLNVRCDDEDVHLKFLSVLCNYCPYVEYCWNEFDTYLGMTTRGYFRDEGERMCYNEYPVGIL